MILDILFRGNVDFNRDFLLVEFTKTVRSNLFECTIYPAVCITFFLLNVILYYVMSFDLFSVTISHTTTSRRSFVYVAPKHHYITVFTVFRLLTDFVCLYTYEFCLSLWKIVRSSVILLLPLFTYLQDTTHNVNI